MIDKQVQHYSEELKKLGIEHTLLEHPNFVHDDDIYAYFNTQSSSGFATLLLNVDGEYIALIRRDDTKVDFSKLGQILKVNAVHVASSEEFTKVTGLEAGLAHVLLPVKQTLLDKKLFEHEFQMGGSGSFTCTIKYKSEDLKKIPNSLLVDVCELKNESSMVQIDVRGKRILAGITPSGDGILHIGNFLGALQQFITLSEYNECFYFSADLHALTTVQNKKQLQGNVESHVVSELAILQGFLSKEEFEKITFFRQSDVVEHTELQSILNNVTPLGLIKRSHAYKDKLEKEMAEEEINMGLFNYPILMAADILLYKPDLVPVGKDQKQHIEITRDIAGYFNNTFKKQMFKLPEGYIPEAVATVLGTDGKRKMSKSLGNIIGIFEDEAVIKKQVMGCFTDPLRKHADDPGHIEGNMVFTYLDFFGEKNRVEELKQLYTEGKVADVEVKNYLFESLMTYFADARKRYQELKANPNLVKSILEKGTTRAREVAAETMREVHSAVGLVNRYSFQRSAISTQSSTVKQSDSKELKTDGFITIDEFAKVELRVGRVASAENVEKSEKLIRLHVDFGPSTGSGLRTIFTGVRGYGYTPENFIGKQFFFVTNLAYRKMLGEMSEGMILAVDSSQESGAGVKPLFVSAEGLPLGATIR